MKRNVFVDAALKKKSPPFIGGCLRRAKVNSRDLSRNPLFPSPEKGRAVKKREREREKTNNCTHMKGGEEKVRGGGCGGGGY